MKYPRYFWFGKKHYKTKNYFSSALPFPENRFGPIPRRFRYSTRNLTFHNPNSHKVQDLYPYLFDYNEVAQGYYIYPRVVFNSESQSYHIVEPKYWGAPLNVGIRSGTWPMEYVTNILTPYFQLTLPKGANINKWLNYPENQCNTSMIIGAMGGGKSVLINNLINLCLTNEACIMAADVFFEARHLANTGTLKYIDTLDYPIDNLEAFQSKVKNPITKVIVLTPIELWLHEESNVELVNKEYIDLPNISIKYFTNSQQVIQALEAGKVLAVFDENFTVKTQNLFWYEIAYQLNRRKQVDFTAILSHHEASKLLPSHPVSGKFEQVQDFANEYVYFRKAEVRTIFGQQLLSEGYWRTNQKTTYIFYKQGSRTDSIRDPQKRAIIQQLALDETLVEFRGSYSLHTTPKFPEAPGKFRIIKLNDIDYGLSTEPESQEPELTDDEIDMRIDWVAINKERKPSELSKTEWERKKGVSYILKYITVNKKLLKDIIAKDTRTFHKYYEEAISLFAEEEYNRRLSSSVQLAEDTS